MRVRALLASVTLLGVTSASASADDAWPERFGFGHEATPAEIAAFDIDILPDGTGLPEGSGSASEGAAIYAVKCAVCHGATGVEGPNDRLVARPDEGFPSGTDANSFTGRTIGNYWPYAPTVFDYVRRSMPQTQPGSLTNDEVYALTAWLLWRNKLIEEDTELTAASLSEIEMPARDQFHPDDRLDYTEVH